MNFNEANSTGIGEEVHEAVFMNKDASDISEVKSTPCQLLLYMFLVIGNN